MLYVTYFPPIGLVSSTSTANFLIVILMELSCVICNWDEPLILIVPNKLLMSKIKQSLLESPKTGASQDIIGFPSLPLGWVSPDPIRFPSLSAKPNTYSPPQ